MHLSLRILFSSATILFSVIVTLCPTVTQAEVYVNMLWDEHTQSYRVSSLGGEGSITFDRDYQNSYGEERDLDPGPPFIVQSSIRFVGAVSFESGGFDPLNPFVVLVQIGEGHDGLISGGAGVNFVGTSLDPIRVEGNYKIRSGIDYRYHSFRWTNTEFRCTHSDITGNSTPFAVTGGSALIEDCYFPDYPQPFNQLISLLDYGAENSCIVTIRNCRFERCDFPNQTYPIIVRDAAEFTLEDCHFEDVNFWEDDLSALMDIRGCGIKSIKGNTGHNNNQNKFRLVGARVKDSAFIRCTESLPIVSSTITVDPGAALAIGRGSLIKFLITGGLDVGGQLYVDSSIFTSNEDDEYGGDTDHKPQPDPFVGNWSINGVCGILVDSTGSANIRRTLIRYPRAGIYAFNQVTLDSCQFVDGWYSGLVLRGAYEADFNITNTTIRNYTRLDPYTAAIFYENRTFHRQSLTLDNVSLLSNAMDGIDFFYMSGGPTRVKLNNCRIADNTGRGIVFPINNALESIDITNSVFVGNAYTAIDGLDNYGSGIPINIENNVVVGNGHYQNATRPDGIHLAGGTCRIVGNTVLQNHRAGILIEGLDNIEQCVVANNLLVGNGEWGLYKSDYEAPIVVGNSHWDNADETQELRYRGPDGWIHTVEELQALGGDFVTNIHVAPGLLPEISGQIDTVIYDSPSGLSKLVDASGSFPSAATLAGRFVCPDTSNVSWNYLWNVSGDTLMFLGDIREHAGTGSFYRMIDFHLSETSQLIDAGFTTQTQEMFDIDGQARILDGDENGSMLVDVGADEFGGEDAASSIRVLQPSSEKLLVAYGTFNIEWQAPDSVVSVNIAYNSSYDPAYPDAGWETIASGTDASSGYYSWSIPDNATTMTCYVRVVSSAHPDMIGMSAPFKIKHTGLTRIRNDSLITYSHPENSWQFSNDSANMWPVEAWPSYILDNDTITGFPYPLEFADIRANSSDFPSWPTFVEAFGFDACYFDYWLGPQYRPSAVLRWGAIKRNWNGSCLGLAVTNLMAFVDSAAFADRPEIGPFTNLNSLGMTDQRRRMISRYFTYQFGKANRDHTRTARIKTPSETLAELRSMFSSMVASTADRVITICDTSSVNSRGCHTVTPYLLERVNQQDNTWSLLVYDNNVPNDFPTIDFNANTNSWTYAQLGLSGDRLFFLEDPLSNYADPAIMTAAPRELPPVATTTSDYFEIYLTNADSVRLELGTGAIGRYHDSLFNTVPGAMPIIPRADGPGDPIGYLVPEGNWSCRLAGVTRDQAHVSVFSDSVIMSYRRNGVVSTEADRVDIRSGAAMHLINPDAAGRDCDIDFVLIAPDRERVLALDNLRLAASDSGTVEVTQATGLRVTNYGPESAYDIVLRGVGNSGLREFTHENVTLEANSVHQLEPDWVDLGREDLMIVIDLGINGVFEDTIFIANSSPTDVDDDESGTILPYRFDLSQNYPNPFNPVTTIEYSLPERSHVTIEVYNVLGQKVRSLVDREESAGSYTTTWDGKSERGQSVSTGVYLYRFQAGDHVETKKMLLLK
ncbi:MAG: right-handed parallel beta-helix repeat-containing protein [Candidatus Zixiibacteriota bacterium]